MQGTRVAAVAGPRPFVAWRLPAWMAALHLVIGGGAWLASVLIADAWQVRRTPIAIAIAIGVFLALGAPMLYALAFRPLRQRIVDESAQFAALLEAAPEGILGVDHRGTIRFANSRLLQMFGYTSAELLGHPVERLVPVDLADRHATMRRARHGGAHARAMGTRDDIVGRRKDGSTVPVDISLNALVVQGEEMQLAVVRDATGHRRSTAELHAINLQLRQTLDDIELREQTLRRVGEMGELLQGAQTEVEVLQVVAAFGERLFPGWSGGLYLLTASRSAMELGAQFGAAAATWPVVVGPDTCWALRRGRLHRCRRHEHDVACRHGSDRAELMLCMPLLAHGETLGILHLSAPAAGTDVEERVRQQLVLMVTEQIGLSLANLRLRESLRNQSVRDALTGLHNRRYMEEWAEGAMLRAQRTHEPLSVILLDLDHFKLLNDTFGHEGGDLVLREVGATLRDRVRGSDLACRLGGEELVVILPDAGAPEAGTVAEELRAAIAALSLRLNGESLCQVTASFGVATSPTHARAFSDLLAAADAALYRAKAEGRNRVVLARA